VEVIPTVQLAAAVALTVVVGLVEVAFVVVLVSLAITVVVVGKDNAIPAAWSISIAYVSAVIRTCSGCHIYVMFARETRVQSKQDGG
jgi:hypothetical protein